MNNQQENPKQTPDRLDRPFGEYAADELFELFTPPKPRRVELPDFDEDSPTDVTVDPVAAGVMALVARENLESTDL